MSIGIDNGHAKNPLPLSEAGGGPVLVQPSPSWNRASYYTPGTCSRTIRRPAAPAIAVHAQASRDRIDCKTEAMRRMDRTAPYLSSCLVFAVMLACFACFGLLDDFFR